MKTLVRIANVPAEIRKEHLPNTSLDRYRHTSLGNLAKLRLPDESRNSQQFMKPKRSLTRL
jgi:hypothetical protein